MSLQEMGIGKVAAENRDRWTEVVVCGEVPKWSTLRRDNILKYNG